MNISLLIISLFLLLALYLGISSTRGKEMSMEQWTVGGRGFGTIFIFFLIAGEVYTTFTFLGGSGWTFTRGAAVYYVPAYIFIAYVLSYWFVPKIWKYCKDNKLITQPDYFASKYKSPALGILVAIVGCVALVPYIVIQFKGLGIIVSQASYGSISPTLASCIGAAVVAIYVMISGIHGSAWTAIIKDFMILIVVVFLGLYIPFHYFGGIQPMFEAVQMAKPELLTLPDAGFSNSWFTSTVLFNAIGFYILPTSFMVILSAKSAKSLRKNAITLPLYTILLIFIFFVGFAAITVIPELSAAQGDLALLSIAIKTFNPWVIGIIGAAGLLTALVPCSVMLMSAAAGLTQNLYKVIVPKASDKHLLTVSKLFIIFISLTALYFTITGGEAMAVLNIMSYSFIVQLAPALFLSLQKNNFITKQGAFVGILSGVLVVLFMTLKGLGIGDLLPQAPQWIQDINGSFVALTVNILMMYGVTIASKVFVSVKQPSFE
ncbi:sodium:solute symporter [Paenisporosarcina sp. OV554]|uniref:sodium:solute symporter family protein n=1 Tax=Paenisporosarcina sp. OV554 TaxID=2135694 RepID=UPI000D342B9E|nr:sodium:solute symporter family protein [Paenisporosarcina sp. OV554]PUB09654.1 SSS family solute:Na+ symporter [Paenisporosarcina sp. OV554]